VHYKVLTILYLQGGENAAEVAEHVAGGQNVACFSAGERKVATNSLK
jgi:hypothetical protein